MTESNIKNYDELPLFMNARQVANALGISKTTAYVLMSDEEFPSIKIGTRILVERSKFKEWVEKSSER
ncbi:MAG: helix-turn-helix domain-containing protein [Clostridia bacterium]|nr:helix-turn-helix domain-containing protein [Clostridia bacterium]